MWHCDPAKDESVVFFSVKAFKSPLLKPIDPKAEGTIIP
jgi:hypothetical protein